MAEVFKNSKKVLTTSMEDAYVCPGGSSAIVIGAQIANLDTAAVGVRLQWTDASDSNAATRLVYDMAIPAGVSIAPVSGKLVLEAGDKIQGYCSGANKAELTLSILELT